MSGDTVGRKRRYAPRCKSYNCAANKKGLCIALDESFPAGDCPFFRDRRTMTPAERYDYDRLADYIRPKEKT